jgi:tryptophan synthase beta chain
MSPLLSHAYELGLLEAESVPQVECFDAAVRFARTEGIVAAPESSHAIAAAVREAHRATEAGDDRVILIALSGHGHFDLAAYDAYLNGRMVDLETPDISFESSLAELPTI